MSDLQTCPVHGLPWKTVPAGVSRTTGKPYTAFQSCPERGCQARPPKPTASPAAGSPESLEQLKKINAQLSEILNRIDSVLNSSGNVAKVSAALNAQRPPAAPDPNDEINVDDIPF